MIIKTLKDIILKNFLNIKLVQQSILDYSKSYAGYDDSDENLDRLYKLIMENKKFVKKNKYIKYSKKEF